MPNLNQIVTQVNSACQNGQFASRRFAASSWNLIADPITTQEKDGSETIRPCIVADDGQCADMSPDDTYSMVVYHKVRGLEYSVPDAEDYGNRGTYVTETASMSMFVFGDKNRLNVRQEDVIAAIHLDMPAEFTPQQLITGVVACVIDYDGVDSKTEEVYKEEWVGHEFKLPPNMFMIRVNYTIIQTYDDCYLLC